MRMGETPTSKEFEQYLHDQNFRFIDERNIRTFSLEDTKNLRQFLDSIGKHKDERNFKILKLTCTSVKSSLNLMLKEWFNSGFKRATHWFFIIAEIEGVFEGVNSENLRLLQQRLGISKPVVIQWKFRSSNKHLVYFKRSNEKDLIPLGVMEKTKLTEEELIEELTPQGIFSLPLLLKALLHGLGGDFSGDLSSTGFDVRREFDGWRMIDYAARDDDDLLLRFLRLVEWDFTAISGEQRVLEIAAEYSSPQSVSAILDQPMIGTEGEQRLSNEQKRLLELVDDTNNTPLTIAVEKGRTETLKYLITCEADVHCRKKVSSKYFTPILTAWEKKFYDKVLVLLEADSPFPAGYKLDNLGGDDIVKLKELTKIRSNFHQNIINNNVSVVKDFISDYPRLRYAYDCNSQTALLTALKARAFEIYALLESKKYLISNDEKVDFTDLIEELSEQQKDKLKQAKLGYFGKKKNTHITYLLTKWREYGGGSADHTDIVRDLFECLDKVPEISTILKVIERAEALDIIFDFNNDSIVDLDPTKSSATSGSCDFKVGLVYVGAKQPLEALLGTLAHELTHLAMQTVFDNDCNPYTTSEEAIKSKFEKIVGEYKDRNEMNDIIARVFTVYTNPNDWPSELIVRVPHLLAPHYKQEDDLQVLENLREEAPELFSFYHENVQSRFEDFIQDPTRFKAQIKLGRLNDLLGQLQTIQESKIRLDSSSLLNEHQIHFSTILIIGSNSPYLAKSDLCQVLTHKKFDLRTECIFTTVEHFKNDRQAEDIQSSFQSTINPILIVDCSRDYDIGHRFLWETIMDFREKRRIVFIAKSETANTIQRKLKSKSGTFEIQLQTNLIRRDYIWADLSVETQHLLWEKPVNFQGYSVALNKLIKCNNSSLPEYISFQDLLQGTPIKVGKPLSRSYGYDERLYIERSLKNSEEVFIYRSILAEELYQQKLVFITDKVGTGKSTYLTHVSKRIKEQNPECWVLRYDLNNHTDLLEEQQKKEMDALQFLRQKLIGLQTQFEETLFEHSLANNKVVLMLNGCDKISSGFQEVVIKLVSNFLNSSIKQLWLVIGPQIELYERDCTLAGHNGIFYYLETFSVENQVKFLTKFWINFSKGDSQTLDLDRMRKYALEVIGILYKSIKDNQKQFISVPLLTRMLGEAFHKEFEEFYYSSYMEPKLPRQLDTLEVFEKFFDCKYLRYFSEKKNVSNINLASEDVLRLLKGEINLREIHQQLALESRFPKQKQNLLEFKRNHVLSPENLKRIGLVDYVGGKPKFIHRTFSEYFVIDFLICELETRNQVYISDFLLKEILLVADCEDMRSFLNSMLERKMSSINSETYSWYGQRIIELWAQGLLRDSEGTILHNAVDEGNQNIIAFLLNSLKSVEQNKPTLKQIFLTVTKVEWTVWRILVKKRNYFIIPKLVEWSEEAGLTRKEFKIIFFSRESCDLTVLHAAVYNDYHTLKKVFHLARTVFTKQEFKSLLLSLEYKEPVFDYYALSSTDGVLIDILTLACEVFDLNDFKHILFASNGEQNTIWHNVAHSGDLNAFDWLFSWSKTKLITKDVKKTILKPGNSLWPSLAGRNSVKVLEKFRKWSEDIKLDFKNDVLLSRNDNSEQAWHIAAKIGDLPVLEKLIEYCQDFGLSLADDLVLSKNNYGSTTWQIAARYGRANVLEYLLKIVENLHLDLKNDLLLYKDNEGRNSWYLTAASADVRSIELIWKISQELLELNELKDVFKTKGMNGYYLLHKIESFSNSDLMNKHWEYGLTVFHREEFKEFFLLSQDLVGRNVCHRLVDTGNVKFIEDLWKLCSRLELNMSDKKKLLLSKDNNGKTPFHRAACEKTYKTIRNTNIVEKLWEFAKATNFTSTELRSLIFDSDVNGYAAWPSEDAIIAKILWEFALEIGLDPKRELLMYKNSRNQTVWHLAVRHRSSYFLWELWELSKGIELTTEEYKMMFLEKDWNDKTVWQVAGESKFTVVLETLKTLCRNIEDLERYCLPTNIEAQSVYEWISLNKNKKLRLYDYCLSKFGRRRYDDDNTICQPKH